MLEITEENTILITFLAGIFNLYITELIQKLKYIRRILKC